MIKLLNENAPFPVLDDGVFSLRQRAFFDAYGAKERFFTVWVQTGENETVTAVITSLSGDITLSLADEADFEEINEFLRVVGFSSIFFNKRYSCHFNLQKSESGKIMELKKELPKTNHVFEEPDYKAIFDLLFSENEISFSDWFTDISYRVRHSAAIVDEIKVDNKTVACALCQAMTDKKALVGSVKTDENYRNKGYATRLVTRLCATLQQRGLEVFLCRENNKNKDFYSRIGFIDCGEWVSIKNE